jgi:hypothetical protein
MQIDAADFVVSAITPGVVIVLSPRHGVPSGLSRVTQINVYTAATAGGWRVGRAVIVRVE